MDTDGHLIFFIKPFVRRRKRGNHIDIVPELQVFRSVNLTDHTGRKRLFHALRYMHRFMSGILLKQARFVSGRGSKSFQQNFDIRQGFAQGDLLPYFCRTGQAGQVAAGMVFYAEK